LDIFVSKKFIIMKNITLENKISSLNEIASFVEHFGAENNLSQKDIFELNLILDELITNIISYGYSDNEVHTIEISVKIENCNLLIKIIDDGKEFNPIERENADISVELTDRKIGGLGIYLVKQKVDSITYQRNFNKNVLTILKKVIQK